ncbi:MAG: DUF971 domain-containing protein [Rhodocyclaceae bacterium]|nr:DUF971 domain-containing protein [Rhodocyclaceae bacterium]
MAGLAPDIPVPVEIKLHRQSRMMEISFADGALFTLPFEYLRVYSPSAAVRGHGAGQEVLQTGKRTVDILGIDPVGNYAVKLTFSDGHDSGLYSWDVLYALGRDQERLWQDYLARLEAAGADRDVDLAAKPAAAGHSCHKH